MVERENAKDGMERARDLSDADNTMPEEAKASYQGPEAFGQAALRGTFFGFVGWKVGNWIDNVGSKEIASKKYRPFKARNVGGLLGFVGGIMGIYGGLKDSRLFRMQVDDLQDIVQKQNKKIGDLQGELKEQIKARNGAGRPKLDRFDPAWEAEEKPKKEKETKQAKEEQPEKEAPESQVDAEEASHERYEEREREKA